MPHFFSSRSNRQYMCDTLCIQWNSAKMCSHTLSVAEINEDLEEFLQLLWYTTSGVSPNITVLGMEGFSKGPAGHKGGRPKRKRSKSATNPERLMTIMHSSASSKCGPSKVNIGGTIMSCSLQLQEALHLLFLCQ